MAKPKVFVSSTYYDLKHIRSSLELFIESLGYEAILSERGNIAYTPDHSLADSCYMEASTADIFVLIVGGRYGSEAGRSAENIPKSFYDHYDSITKNEFETANSKRIPTYILIDIGVYSEYKTYQQNKNNENIKYAHVDSVNVFKLIEDVLSKQDNNPIFPFDRFTQIEEWLREQWAGYFSELLRARIQQVELLDIAEQVNELRTINETLKNYLEALITGVGTDDPNKLIESEARRIELTNTLDKLKNNTWISHVINKNSVSLEKAVKAIRDAKNVMNFIEIVSNGELESMMANSLMNTLCNSRKARKDFNLARIIVGATPIKNWDIPIQDDP